MPDLRLLVDDDLVGDAPPELQRHTRARDRADVGHRAARRVRAGGRAWATTDLAPGELAEARAEGLLAEQRPAGVVAAEPGEVPVLERHVGHRGERRGARQQLRMARDQEERLLAAHAAAERVDLAPVDPQPRQGGAQDLGHPREVGDLARVAPRVAGDPPAARIRVDDGEGAAAGQVAPEDRVRAPAQAAAVRRDHERQRRVRGRPVPGWKHDERAARPAVVGDVADLPALDGGHPGGRGRPAAAVPDDQLEPTAAAGEVDRLAELLARRAARPARRRSSPTRSRWPRGSRSLSFSDFGSRPLRHVHRRENRVAPRLERVRHRPEARRRAR